LTVQRDSEPAAPLDGVRPSGKRSTKRDLIVDVFLRQEGALTADDLFDLIRREDSGKGDGHPAVDGISRATVYRTLQWMADAGIARKVDFAGGRIRFEHSYRHPRHFHLICKTCNQSFEFLSSDIESLIEEVAGARNFAARQSVLQIHGTCEACRTGRPAPSEGGSTERVFARDALRIAIATERSGLEFYSRAATMTRDPRGRRVFQKLAAEDRARLSRLEERYRELLQQDSQLEARPTFLFFKGAANGLFAAATLRLENRLDVRQALMMAIRCERGSHRFFKRYGDKFEDSEGKKIFLRFADEERAHLELLIREYRALSGARRRARGARGSTRRPRREPAVVR
jgi:Fur family transcriptional regulator, ferric uptake regulator